jgi:hypothetical protein
VDRETAPVKTALSGPNREPRSPNVKLIGCCQSVRQGLSFLGLRTVERAGLRTISRGAAAVRAHTTPLGVPRGNGLAEGLGAPPSLSLSS